MDDSAEMARLTFLIDGEEKHAFARLCASQDLTSSQVLRRLIADYLGLHPMPAAAATSAPQPACPTRAP